MQVHLYTDYIHMSMRVYVCLSQCWKPDLSSGRTNTSAGHPKRHSFCKSRTTWGWIRIRHKPFQSILGGMNMDYQ